MRYTSKINFDAEIPNGIDLTGTGLSFAMVGDIPCGYYGNANFFDKLLTHRFYMIPITIPKGFKLKYFSEEDGIEDIDEVVNENFQIMLLSDIELATPLNYVKTTSQAVHDFYKHDGHGCASRTCTGGIFPTHKPNSVFYYEFMGNYYLPLFFPNFSTGYYKFTSNQDESQNIERLKLFVNQVSMQNSHKAFPFILSEENDQYCKLIINEKLSCITYVENLSAL